jgi:hypothetical protein
VTPPALPRPPDPFPPTNPILMLAGTVLHRTHTRTLRPAEFNPGRGQPTRFSPFDDAAGFPVPTLYAGTNREAAAFESIFHDIEPGAPFKTVRLDLVEARSVSRVAPRRDLKLGGLFAPDLKACGIARTDLIETPKSICDQTVLWAQAIHRSDSKLDGLVWSSRQCDPERCVVLFGDRVTEADLEVIERLEVACDPALLLALRGFGLRAGISIVN